MSAIGSAEGWRVYAIHLPSGLHAGLPSCPGSDVRRRVVVPLVVSPLATTQMSELSEPSTLSRLLVNAMRRPSGDHTGPLSSQSPEVICRGVGLVRASNT